MFLSIIKHENRRRAGKNFKMAAPIMGIKQTLLVKWFATVILPTYEPLLQAVKYYLLHFFCISSSPSQTQTFSVPGNHEMELNIFIESFWAVPS